MPWQSAQAVGKEHTLAVLGAAWRRRMGGCQRAVRKLGAVSGGRGSSAGSTPLLAPQDYGVCRPRKRRHLCGRYCWARVAAAQCVCPLGSSLRRVDCKQGTIAHRTGTTETNRGILGPPPLPPGPILGVSKIRRRARAADTWIQCCSNSRPPSTGGLTRSMCLTVTIVASIESGSAAPPRGNAGVPAGVWIGWASPCPRTATAAPPVPPTAVAKAAGFRGHWQEHGAVILGHLLSDE